MNNLLLSLAITAIGMGLVFAALILIWWMMALLTRLTAEKEVPARETAPSPANDEKARAAAIGVAIAMADHQLSQAHPLHDPPTAIVSAWQLGMRTRQLSQKGTPIVRNPRKIG